MVESGRGWGSLEDLCTSSLLESLLSHKEVKKECVHGLREGVMKCDEKMPAMTGAGGVGVEMHTHHSLWAVVGSM